MRPSSRFRDTAYRLGLHTSLSVPPVRLLDYAKAAVAELH
jgi:hypothetical protein